MIKNNKKVVKGYQLYQFHKDPFINNSESILPGERGEVIEPITEEAINRMSL